ncbi:hypothetical protein DXG01_005445 [Tephrocybe rancida]|nr:hypothetical protein DXG01_005445 [Tephrocybe rancida]
MTVLYPNKSGPVAHYPNTPGPYIGAVIFELFLYGIYFVLCLAYAAILLHKRRIFWVPLIAAVTMFGIATADVGYTLNLLFRKLLVQGLEYEELRPKYIMYVANSIIADTFLLYKFYLIYGSKKWMLVAPGLLLVAATACGLAFEGTNVALSQHSWINVTLTAVLNVVITGLTAGRIAYIGKYARAMLGTGVPYALSMCAAVMIESGTVYTVYVSLDLAFRTNPTANIILDGGLIQIVGIMPTLILVQISLGRASNIGTPSSYTQQQATGGTTVSYWSDETRRTHAFASDIPLAEAASAPSGFQAV